MGCIFHSFNTQLGRADQMILQHCYSITVFFTPQLLLCARIVLGTSSVFNITKVLTFAFITPS